MTSGETSEWDLIEWICQQPQHFPPSLIKNIGDDCAVFEPQTKSLSVTTDLLVEDEHFQRGWISPYFLGRKALSANLSDLAAMGALPYATLLALALPAELKERYFRSFVRGYLEEASLFQAPLVGGDLSHSRKICIGVTAWGGHEDDEPIWRSAARPGDSTILIGDVGFSRLGLEILRNEDTSEIAELSSEKALSAWAGSSFRNRCLRAHLMPRALVEVGNWLCRNRLVHAMIDVSDGLAADLLHIASQSQLQAEIQIEKLPIPEKGVYQIDPLEAALNGGEDYALLCTASTQQLKLLTSTYPPDFPSFHVIGTLIEGKPALYVCTQGRSKKYQPKGFDHFKCNK